MPSEARGWLMNKVAGTFFISLCIEFFQWVLLSWTRVSSN